METYTPPSFVAWGDDFLLFPRINIRSVSRTSVTHLCPTYSRTVRFAIVRNDPSPSTDSPSTSSASYSFSSFSALFSFGLYRRSISFHAIRFLSNECTRIVPRFRSINPRSNPRSSRRLYSNFPAERDRARRKDGGDEKVIKRKGKGKSRLIA